MNDESLSESRIMETAKVCRRCCCYEVVVPKDSGHDAGGTYTVLGARSKEAALKVVISMLKLSEKHRGILDGPRRRTGYGAKKRMKDKG